MKQKSSNEVSVQSSPVDQIWLDETLSDQGLGSQHDLLDAKWSEVCSTVDLQADQIAARPKVRKYLETRIEIINALVMIRSRGDKGDEKRTSEIRSMKKQVLKLVSNERFLFFMKSFGITEDHPLSPANLFPKTIARVGKDSQKGPNSLELAKLLPHYTSPWKNAILLAFLAKGLEADYFTLGQYIAKNFAFVDLPNYCGEHKRESIDFLIASVRDRVGDLRPRFPEINAAFQRDRGRIKGDMESCLQKLCDSLGV